MYVFQIIRISDKSSHSFNIHNNTNFKIFRTFVFNGYFFHYRQTKNLINISRNPIYLFFQINWRSKILAAPFTHAPIIRKPFEKSEKFFPNPNQFPKIGVIQCKRRVQITGNRARVYITGGRPLFDFSVPLAAKRGGGDFWAAERAHRLPRAKHLRHHGDSASGDTLGLPAQTAELSRQPLSAPHHPLQGTYTE